MAIMVMNIWSRNPNEPVGFQEVKTTPQSEFAMK